MAKHEFRTPGALPRFDVPPFDISALIDCQQRNMGMLVQANRVAFEGAQAVALEHAAMMREFTDDMTKVVASVSRRANADPADHQGDGPDTDPTQAMFEHAAAHIRQIAEQIASSNDTIFQLFDRRTREIMDEVNAMSRPQGPDEKG